MVVSEWLELVIQNVKSLRYGVVEIVVHDRSESTGDAQRRQSHELERQVRIVAGSLVFIGVALGWFVHRGFYGLPAFVGAGLVFAGITDICSMGLLLARMRGTKSKLQD